MSSCLLPTGDYSSKDSYETECTSDDGQPALEAEATRLNNAESVFCESDTPASWYCPYSIASTPSSIAIDGMCAAYEQHTAYFGQYTDKTCYAVNEYAKERALSDKSLPATFDNDEGREVYERTVAAQFKQVKKKGCLYPFETRYDYPYYCGYPSKGKCKF
ncbi:hypothetical protein SARC_04281 [Sphaeroforma arctica JP610]|uniref:Uncharacterized protein n=1 Tax=Sphaeroforma arctica JP610 TaxID=667725 RepID=A0A0L0G2W4_9EUKA|nr:hypothetical protein SARC_04281 [Sphaeroforma arctica JP610]KNC83472.1 hypothetical protein SARC_04281 [Sphaeroforma arctica JP610]|eukprot:XP_014157374.1 hypothetical protein SARC_04281 [Sphaeroforma arctica JP610]